MDLWKRKLGVFLHDPPESCLNVNNRERKIKNLAFSAEETSELDNVTKLCDHFATAADRFAFPKGKCTTHFTGKKGATFTHPLSSQEYEIDNLKPIEQYSDLLQIACNSIECDDPKTALFLLWRRWYENAATNANNPSPELAFFPADSRIPDHSIWNHLCITSALSATYNGTELKPALLLFQFGPVQDFIAQARTTRDMWSGSYLLSWLIAHGMKAITDEIGPDAIIFPNLRGNGIFDALHKDSIYAARFTGKDGRRGESIWDRLKEEKGDNLAQWLLTPTLPNRFLALVPEKEAVHLAQAAEKAIRAELKAIGEAVWKWIEQTAKDEIENVENQLPDWKLRWDTQLEAFPQISWAIQPWLERDECLNQFKELPINKLTGETPYEHLKNFLALGEKWMPENDRDEQYYADSNKKQLKNSGVLWSAHYALLDAKLAARRNTREFDAWKGANGAVKDSLSGKEESIGSEEFWKKLNEKYSKIFTAKAHCYGTMNLIKRLWCRDEATPYLKQKLGLKGEDFGEGVSFDDIHQIAKCNQYGGNYFAVITMDGDEMGKWVSGAKTPKFMDQLSKNAKDYLDHDIVTKHPELKNLRRVLTPSYHLQFSEALSNFATYVAEPIVEAYQGQLIYAGGDDVLAMLPADRAIDCAADLRRAFRGEKLSEKWKNCRNFEKLSFDKDTPGYVKTTGLMISLPDKKEQQLMLTLPGSEADVSCGIAIAHEKAPLQMVIQEARAAESRAKHEYDRGAMAISVYKRSGEILQWGFKWDSYAIKLMDMLTEYSKRDDHKLSARFSYALAQFLAPYQLDQKAAINYNDMKAIIKKELAVVVRQQGSELDDTKDEKRILTEACEKWLDELKEQQADEVKEQQADEVKEQQPDKPKDDFGTPFKDFITLFLTATFLTRTES